VLFTVNWTSEALMSAGSDTFEKDYAPSALEAANS
jgi:hypothetical protein